MVEQTSYKLTENMIQLNIFYKSFDPINLHNVSNKKVEVILVSVASKTLPLPIRIHPHLYALECHTISSLEHLYMRETKGGYICMRVYIYV